MEIETAKQFNQVSARLFVLEAAIDAIFSVASREPTLRALLEDAFDLQVSATQDAHAGSTDTAMRQTLRESAQRFLEALRHSAG